MDIWELLRHVQTLQLKAVTGDPHNFFHQATAAGWVSVEKTSADFLTFHETGRWVSRAGQAVDFHNTYRWSLAAADVLRLEHLRYGRDNPVHLVDFSPCGPGGMHSVAAHRCGSDRYSAGLTWAGGCVRLKWKIKGPLKDDILDGVYRTEA